MAEPLSITDVIDTIGAIAIPVVIFYLGYRFNHLSLIANLTENLTSDSKEKRMISLMLIRHLKSRNTLPSELLDSVSMIAVGDDLDLAGAAGLIVDSEKIPDTVILYELLAPLKRHFEITKKEFQQWRGFNENIENKIRDSNKLIRDRLVSRWHLIPDDLKGDAQALISHYDAWLNKYDELRSGGERDKTIPYVFVGPDGYGFPVNAEKKFIKYYEDLSSKL